MVGLPEISLLCSDLLFKYIRVNDFFDLIILFFLYLFHCFVEVNFFLVDLLLSCFRSKQLTIDWRFLFHFKIYSLSNNMSNKGEGKKLWHEIGLDESPLSKSNFLSQPEGKSEKSVVLSSKPLAKENSDNWLEGENISVVQSQGKISKKSMDEVSNRAERFQKMMLALNVEMMQIESGQPMQIMVEESHIQRVIETASMKSEEREEGQSEYNQEISRIPESITPLVYSKSSKPIEEIKFNKNQARFSLLKLTVSEVQNEVKLMKSTLENFFSQVRDLHFQFQQKLCEKYKQLERQYSIKLQQSVFHHKQEYEQLRYEYEILKNKEQITRTPIKSEVLIPQMQASEIVDRRQSQKLLASLKQNMTLKEKITFLEQQKEKMLKEAAEFKEKISGIELKTQEIRQSNDKLYEYIFDLQQQIAYHKEEIPKITKQIKEEFRQNYERQLQELQQEKQHTLSQEEQNKSRLNALEKEKKDISQKLQKSQNQLTQLKIDLGKKIEEQEKLETLCLSKDETITNLNKRLEETEVYLKKLTEEKETYAVENSQSLKKIKNDSPRRSRAEQTWEKGRQKSRQSIVKELLQTKDKEDKKWMESLQIQKLVLQKQNVHLKAAVEFYSKNYGSCAPLVTQPHSPRQTTSYSIENHFGTVQDRLTETESNLQIKERELQKYQNYLDSEARKLESKQKELESEYIIKKTLEQKYRDSNQCSQKPYIQDDYGMKNFATINPRSYNVVPCVQQRKNQFCSSEAQAIIEKVKMRQKNNNTSCHSHCQNSGKCRCDVLSRGSRDSRDSSSRDYYRMGQYRPSNASPSPRMDDYYRGQQKSSKMKVIEDKVKRLKSELKNSLSAMKT